MPSQLGSCWPFCREYTGTEREGMGGAGEQEARLSPEERGARSRREESVLRLISAAPCSEMQSRWCFPGTPSMGTREDVVQPRGQGVLMSECCFQSRSSGKTARHGREVENSSFLDLAGEVFRPSPVTLSQGRGSLGTLLTVLAQPQSEQDLGSGGVAH